MCGKFAKLSLQILIFSFLASSPFLILISLNGLILNDGIDFIRMMYLNLYLAFVIHEMGHLSIAFLLLPRQDKSRYEIKWNFRGVSQFYTSHIGWMTISISLAGALANLISVIVARVFFEYDQAFISFSILLIIVSLWPGANDFNSIMKVYTK